MQSHASPPYAELHAVSNFSFLRGASHPEELVMRAARLDYAALAMTDECSLAGAVRAHVAAKKQGLKLIVGSEFHLEDGPHLVLLATDRQAYGHLSELITRGRRRAAKGGYRLSCRDLEGDIERCLALWIPGSPPAASEGRWMAERFPGRTWLVVELLRGFDDGARLKELAGLGEKLALPLAAAGDVHMHVRARRTLQDTLTAIRLGCTVAEAGHALYANGERHLRSRETLAVIYPRELMEETLEVAARCRFSLDSLRYEYPEELVPPGETPSSYLSRLTQEGMRQRWPQGVPDKVRETVAHELDLIRELAYEPYFLTVHDLVRFARRRGILCQGRGSAANSAVCYCLGITEVDPSRMETLFERFISRERNEPPDIDVDFEHERREEVIQYIYDKYGRERAALAATVVSYRPRSAIRDVGKALGFDAFQVDRLAKSVVWWDGRRVQGQRLKELGFDPASPPVRRWIRLVNTLVGFPRHLSQHVGGFVIARGSLSRLVPIENAAMPKRTVIQWDKDDLDALGLLKVDVLALGMLTAIHRAFDLIAGYRGTRYTMADIPAEDPEVYKMIQRADTAGVFQIESRAQMAMLPRLKPETFYDLVIEVAIVRPGPIQGGMVHPYLRRRQGKEFVTYPSEAVRTVLERTLGVPIFQEQVMRLAVVAAGFSPGEADQLRRAMAAWRRKGGLGAFERRLHAGMRARGYGEEFARRIFRQIQGFGEYGFPESHAASFALLVYVSAWLKRHEPAAFTCALLNSQPMGFYAPAQLVRDVRDHGVEVRPVDVRYSHWDCTLETLQPCTSHPHPDPLPQGRGEGGAADPLPRCRGDVDDSFALQREDAPVSFSLSPGTGLYPHLSPYMLGGRLGAANGRWVGRKPCKGRSAGCHTGRRVPCVRASRGLKGRATQSPPAGLPFGGTPCGLPPYAHAELGPQVTGFANIYGVKCVPGQAPGRGEGWGEGSQPALRLGLRMIKGLSKAGAERLVAAREDDPYRNVQDLSRRAKLSRGDMERLAAAGALAGIAGHRHEAHWQIAGVEAMPPLFTQGSFSEDRALLPAPTESQEVVADYAALGLSLRRHPLALLRNRFKDTHKADQVRRCAHGDFVRITGLVIARQCPSTASGVVFATLEDETGFVNVVVWPKLADAQRRALVGARLLEVTGKVEREGDVIHVVAARLCDRSRLLGQLQTHSRDFH